MGKFKLHDLLAQGVVPLSIAIGMVLHEQPERDGYSALPGSPLNDMPEDGFAGRLPIRLRPGRSGPYTFGNGTSTFVQGTDTIYAWPVPRT
jgi:hypothetical protein